MLSCLVVFLPECIAVVDSYCFDSSPDLRLGLAIGEYDIGVTKMIERIDERV
jgi:hypothetical protein